MISVRNDFFESISLVLNSCHSIVKLSILNDIFESICLVLNMAHPFLRPFQNYFSSYETGQSVGGAKTGEPREKTPDTRKQNLTCLTCGQSGARTRTRHSGEMIE